MGYLYFGRNKIIFFLTVPAFFIFYCSFLLRIRKMLCYRTKWYNASKTAKLVTFSFFLKKKQKLEQKKYLKLQKGQGFESKIKNNFFPKNKKIPNEKCMVSRLYKYLLFLKKYGEKGGVFEKIFFLFFKQFESFSHVLIFFYFLQMYDECKKLDELKQEKI